MEFFLHPTRMMMMVHNNTCNGEFMILASIALNLIAYCACVGLGGEERNMVHSSDAFHHHRNVWSTRFFVD